MLRLTKIMQGIEPIRFVETRRIALARSRRALNHPFPAGTFRLLE